MLLRQATTHPSADPYPSELLDYLSGDSPQLRDLPDQGKGEGGVLLNGELSGSLEMKSDSKTKQSNKNQRK